MKEFHGTKGKWTYSRQIGTTGYCHCAQVWDSTGRNLATIEPTVKAKEATANARLIASSQNLLKALQETLTALHEDHPCRVNAEKVINKALGL